MTTPRKNATTTLLHRLVNAGGPGLAVDKMNITELATLRTLVRRGQASISFGRAFATHDDGPSAA